MTLPVSRLIRVSINLGPTAPAPRSFGILMIAGDSNVINGLERFRSYDSFDGVALDFSTTSPEYLAAQLYFGQSPKPKTCMIGRWVRTATAAELDGGILNASQQLMTNFNPVTSGGFQVTVDGVVKSLTGLDFSAAANLNAVAAIIDAALSGASCIWDGDQFIIASDTTGTGVKASGTITFDTNAAANDTVTIDGTLVTFVASSPTGSQVLIGASAAATATNLNTFLNASADANISLASYSVVGSVVTATYKTVGTTGNSFTLAKSSTHITLSGGTLTGGVVSSSVTYATAPVSGTDISSLLKLTSSLALPLVPAYAAETPVECAAVLANASSAWYGLTFAASVMPTDDQNLDVSSFVEALDLSRIFGVTITDTSVLSSVVTTDLASEMKAANYLQSFCQYSANPYAIASLFGRMFSVNFSANRSTITLMYKQEPGVVAEDLTTTQANVLQAKRCNVFTSYVNDTAIIQYGVMSGPRWIDETHGLDWFKDSVQNSVYTLLYTSTTKIPQTDAGANQLVNAVQSACDQAVTNGFFAPGVWNGAEFGQLTTGQFLNQGYYIYAQPIAQQSQADRDARIAPPITVAGKLAGAIQEADILVNINR